MSFSKESMKWAALGLGAVAAAGIAIYMASPRVGGDDDPSKDDGKKEEEKKEESVPAKEPPVVGDKYITYGDDKTNQFSNPLYDEEWARSINNREEFWTEKAKDLTWTKFPTKILDTSH